MASDLSEISDIAWHAMSERDRHYDGRFVYAALTTGIYCRPSCPARHPRRQNALVFTTAAEAGRQGYVACRRCRPDSLTAAEKSVKAAIYHIEAHLDQTINLNTLSQISGLSPNHLQQSFKRIVGLSPKAFCDTRRLLRFKQQLRLGESVSSAGYGAGFGSSRALYEQASKSLGMTPATYQHGGDGMHLHYALTDAVLGRVLVAGTQRGICTVLLGENDQLLVDQLYAEFPRAVFTTDEASFGDWRAVIESCQGEDPLISTLPLGLRGQIFQARVYKSLQEHV